MSGFRSGHNFPLATNKNQGTNKNTVKFIMNQVEERDRSRFCSVFERNRGKVIRRAL